MKPLLSPRQSGYNSFAFQAQQRHTLLTREILVYASVIADATPQLKEERNTKGIPFSSRVLKMGSNSTK